RDTIMRARDAGGGQRVLWLTLREQRQSYATMNTQIRAATAKWPQLVAVDWNATSRNRPWFTDDGLHLDYDGAMGMARLLRKYVVTYACGGGCHPLRPPRRFLLFLPARRPPDFRAPSALFGRPFP